MVILRPFYKFPFIFISTISFRGFGFLTFSVVITVITELSTVEVFDRIFHCFKFYKNQ